MFNLQKKMKSIKTTITNTIENKEATTEVVQTILITLGIVGTTTLLGSLITILTRDKNVMKPTSSYVEDGLLVVRYD